MSQQQKQEQQQQHSQKQDQPQQQQSHQMDNSQVTKNLLWPSYSFTENTRPPSSIHPPSSPNKSSRYYSSTFRTFLNDQSLAAPGNQPNPYNNNSANKSTSNSNNATNNNMSTVQFELTDESSLLKPPIASLSAQLSKDRKNKSQVPKSASSVKYIFLKQEHESTNKALGTKHLSLSS